MICLTFDIEERFHSHLNTSESPREWKMRDRISIILDYLIQNKIKATFFIVGELAEIYPDIIRKMSSAEFEIGSHSYSHLRLDQNNIELCKNDISRSKMILEDISGQPVNGFRAPTWTASLKDEWLWEHLASIGFKYDSSLFPFRTHLYGSFSNPTNPFKINSELIEIPPSVFQFGKIRIPYGGGCYFRLYPLGITNKFVKYNLKTQKAQVLYFHPWDFEVPQSRTEKGMLNSFIGNYNIKNNWWKFTELVSNFNFTTMRELVDNPRDLLKFQMLL